MNLCDSEAVLVYMVSSRLAKIKHGILPTRLPLPPPKKKEKERNLHGYKRREGAVHFRKRLQLPCKSVLQLGRARAHLQSFLSRSLVL